MQTASSRGCFASTKKSNKAVLEVASQNKPALISKAKEKHRMSSLPADFLALASGFCPCDANFPEASSSYFQGWRRLQGDAKHLNEANHVAYFPQGDNSAFAFPVQNTSSRQIKATLSCLIDAGLYIYSSDSWVGVLGLSEQFVLRFLLQMKRTDDLLNYVLFKYRITCAL